MRILLESTADRASWLAARQLGIGASEVAALLGCNPWSSPFEVWARKTGRLPPVEETERMRWGSRLEDAILAGYGAEHGRRVRRVQSLLADELEPRLLATPDGEDLGPVDGPDEAPVLIETKLTSQPASEWRSAGAPIYYQLQLQAQLAVTDGERGKVAALHSNELTVHPYDRHPRCIDTIREVVGRFWRDHVETDRQPGAHHPADGATLRALYPTESGATIELDEDAMELANRLEFWKGEVGRTMDEKRALESRLCQLLGSATVGLLPDGRRVQWRTEARKEHTVSASAPRVLRILKATGGRS